MKTMIIVEGMDGTGKTSFCKSLVKEKKALGLNVVCLKFPSKYPEEGQFEGQPLIREVNFYLDDFEAQLEGVEDDVEVIVCDRSFISTAVYQGFQDLSVREDMFEYILHAGADIFGFNDPKVIPEFVLLESSAQTSFDRVTARAQEDKDELERMTPEDMKARLQILKDRYMLIRLGLSMGFWCRTNQTPHLPVLTIDTDGKTREEVFKEYLSF